MKKLTGSILSWVLYYLGHWTGRVMERDNTEWLYSTYNWFMTKSSDVQDWSGTESGPWSVVGSGE